jgi:alkanesulfonate monooxygenase SsuD/methylene tetrahydromethanopterin reductase-like flavin-dependent oxidoreductase (luciferase family)
MTTPLRDSLEAALAQIDAFHRGVADVGVEARDRKFSMLRMIYVAKDKADAREKLAIANQNDQRFHNLYTTPGTVRNGAVVPIETGRTLEEVDRNLIIGSPEECIEKLTPYAERGLFDFMANLSFGAPHRDVMGAMERLARDVMPHFRATPETSARLPRGKAS